MKRLNNLTRRNRLALLAGLVLMMAFGATTARAQVRPFLDCVERERDANGSFTDNYNVYFGYSSQYTSDVVYYAEGSSNYFDPYDQQLTMPSTFTPGVHPRVALIKASLGDTVTWYLGASDASASLKSPSTFKNLLCSEDGANSRLITYQGRLSDGAQSANGTYDLQFQLFDQLTGGTARTSLITLDDVPVTNGIFTVQLDLGVNAQLQGNPAGYLKLNPGITDAGNSFFEISVRAGTSTGAYAKLTPRQPLTAVPLAMRANTANNAFRAVNADQSDVARRLRRVLFADNSLCTTFLDSGAVFASEDGNKLFVCGNSGIKTIRGYDGGDFILNTSTQQTGNFNISGNGSIGGNLSVGGTINGTVSNATNAAQLGGVAANQYLTTTSANSNYIQNTTTQQTANFNVSGSGAIGGSLTISGTLSSGCRAGFTAIAGGRLCVSEMQTAATFYGANGAVQICTNLAARVGNSADAMLTFSQTGFNYFGGTSSGWLADNLGDDLRATWNVSAPAPNFDGAPVNVFTTATSLPFRCVY